MSIVADIERRLEDLRERLRERLATRRTVLGIPVVISNPGTYGSDAQLLEKLTAALDLVARHQPSRLRRIQGDVGRIWLRPLLTHRASFIRATRTCNLDVYFVATFPAPMIAASIVHEGMHARITAAGVALPPAREERACRRAELKLGRSIPDQAVIDRATAALALPDHGVAPGVDVSATRSEPIPLPGWARRWLR